MSGLEHEDVADRVYALGVETGAEAHPRRRLGDETGRNRDADEIKGGIENDDVARSVIVLEVFDDDDFRLLLAFHIGVGQRDRVALGEAETAPVGAIRSHEAIGAYYGLSRRLDQGRGAVGAR